MKVEYKAHLENLAGMMAFIHDQAKGCGFEASKLHCIELACEEALVNIIKHGYPKTPGQITLHCNMISGKGIEIIISDQGIPFNPLNHIKKPSKATNIESKPLGGYGIHLILQLMDDVKYQRMDNFNCLTLIKYS